MRAIAVLAALLLAACQTTTPERLAELQAIVASEMGIDFYIPAPTIVETYDLSADGRTLARTTCWTPAKVVMSIEYAKDVDWEKNMATIAHELHHAIQCHSGRMQTLTNAESEREAEAVESWWTANH